MSDPFSFSFFEFSYLGKSVGCCWAPSTQTVRTIHEWMVVQGEELYYGKCRIELGDPKLKVWIVKT
jgi:hypothetical protein